MKKIVSIVGARPNFMKVAPIHRELNKYKNVQSIIVHTGQHFDDNMSKVFFDQLDLPQPDYYLGVSGGTHTWVTTNIMSSLEKILTIERPDLLIVVGDVTSTLAAALVAKQLNIKLVHVESGLRSFDEHMQEEINRKLTDHLSNFLFTTEYQARLNLINEGISEDKIYFVGNCMVDSLAYYLNKSEESDILVKLNLQHKKYVLVTMHRPSNVDSAQGLSDIIEILKFVSLQVKIVFPIHPRTKSKLILYNLWDALQLNINIIITEPQGYLEFIKLMNNASCILTDSGGVQEESTYLKIPCLTFRKNTERPITVEIGTNQLLGDLKPETAILALSDILSGHLKPSKCPDLWDGQAAGRIVSILNKIL